MSMSIFTIENQIKLKCLGNKSFIGVAAAM
jgi:hypothetical protein